jgi:hypothetical protein
LYLAPLTLAIALGSAEAGPSAPQTELIAPGVWRLHFGNPEELTPTHFRSAPIDDAGLETMPLNEAIPLDPAKISFEVSDRGCSLQLPMKSGENIYGFGLTRNFSTWLAGGFFLDRRTNPKMTWANPMRPCRFTFPRKAMASLWTQRDSFRFTPEMFRRLIT